MAKRLKILYQEKRVHSPVITYLMIDQYKTLLDSRVLSKWRILIRIRLYTSSLSLSDTVHWDFRSNKLSVFLSARPMILAGPFSWILVMPLLCCCSIKTASSCLRFISLNYGAISPIAIPSFFFLKFVRLSAHFSSIRAAKPGIKNVISSCPPSSSKFYNLTRFTSLIYISFVKISSFTRHLHFVFGFLWLLHFATCFRRYYLDHQPKSWPISMIKRLVEPTQNFPFSFFKGLVILDRRSLSEMLLNNHSHTVAWMLQSYLHARILPLWSAMRYPGSFK